MNWDSDYLLGTLISRFIETGEALIQIQQTALRIVAETNAGHSARERAAKVTLYIAEYSRGHRTLDEMRGLLREVTA